MSDVYIVLVYLTLLGAGLAAPFALTLGYVWVDLSYPQYLSTYLTDRPVALVMGSAAVIAYLVADRRSTPRLNLVTVLTVCTAVWVTLTCFWAVAPSGMVWDKWNWAWKTVLFSAFIPYVIRSRVQIEAFLQVFLFSIAVTILPGALKTLMGGTGYGRAFGIIRSNSGLFESSTIAAVAVMIIPILLTLNRHSTVFPQFRGRAALYIGYAVLSSIAAIGTYARTAIVGFAILALGALAGARRRVVVLLVIVMGVLAATYFGPASWQMRMDTIDTYDEDNSAVARILVWEWTLGFVLNHPLGGGFYSHVVDNITLPSGRIASGVAFHNAYIEILGEHGWPGLGLFAVILLMSFRNLRRVRRDARGSPELSWCHALAGAMLLSLLVLAGCANFVGIAFQPLFWYMFAVTVALREHVFRYFGTEAAMEKKHLIKTVAASN